MAKCKNCKNLYYAEVIFKHGTSTIPCCFADGEEIEDICEEKECFGFECMSNADRIRSMTDGELASFLVCDCREYMALKNGCPHATDMLDSEPSEPPICCEECILRWLKSEVGCE